MDWLNNLKFNEKGLIPAVAQEYRTGKVLMQAWMSKDSILKTMETGKVCYFSRSRNELWTKGETSGHFQILKNIYIDCDMDSLLLKVEQVGGIACHTGEATCFYRNVFGSDEHEADSTAITDVFDVIKDRQVNPVEGSYTNYLLTKGADKILKKVGEEAAEVIIATKNKSKEEIIYETADLMYHLTVNLVNEGLDWMDIFYELNIRKK